MPSLALIPGFATDAHFSGFRGPWGPDGGFRAFCGEVECGNAVVFRWGLRAHANFLQSVNPWFAWKLYRAERQLTEQAELQQRLFEWLERERPHTVVCHSLGCRLFAKMVLEYGIPTGVRRAVFNQADISAMEFSDAVKKASGIQFVNTYCAWDPSLLCSSILNGKWRAGLCAMPITSVQNKFFPLRRFPNLHMSAIRDKGLTFLCR